MGNRLAAVDLGSNSFRLEIGRAMHGSFERTEYLRETVRQGGGLDEDRNLTPAAMQSGWDCLARFAERLAGFQPSEVRAVATQTLREARNRDVFLQRAQSILGFPINVISGREEARLIYQGVSHMLAQCDEGRLVIDVGGRSTELILGQGRQATDMESFRVGSIAWSQRYFPDGSFTKRSFAMAEIAAKAVLDEAIDTFHRTHWDCAYGSAGTVGAVCDILAANGWPEDVITTDSLEWLLDRLVLAQSAERLRIAGIREDRKAIIGGGVSILRAVFDLLGIDRLQRAEGGLRHGLICDLLGEATHFADDLRQNTVARLALKFGVDRLHGERVGRVATMLFEHIGPMHVHTDVGRHQRKLGWAALLHEIGSHISHNGYHRHGAYILDNVDAFGFSISEMHRLSLLVLGHRGKLRKVEDALTDPDLVAQLLALRLAVLLCHARRDPDLQGMDIRHDNRTFHLTCRPGWADTFPQSAYLLREEVLAWQRSGWSLELAGC